MSVNWTENITPSRDGKRGLVLRRDAAGRIVVASAGGSYAGFAKAGDYVTRIGQLPAEDWDELPTPLSISAMGSLEFERPGPDSEAGTPASSIPPSSNGIAGRALVPRSTTSPYPPRSPAETPSVTPFPRVDAAAERVAASRPGSADVGAPNTDRPDRSTPVGTDGATSLRSPSTRTPSRRVLLPTFPPEPPMPMSLPRVDGHKPVPAKGTGDSGDEASIVSWRDRNIDLHQEVPSSRNPEIQAIIDRHWKRGGGSVRQQEQPPDSETHVDRASARESRNGRERLSSRDDQDFVRIHDSDSEVDDDKLVHDSEEEDDHHFLPDVDSDDDTDGASVQSSPAPEGLSSDDDDALGASRTLRRRANSRARIVDRSIKPRPTRTPLKHPPQRSPPFPPPPPLCRRLAAHVVDTAVLFALVLVTAYFMQEMPLRDLSLVFSLVGLCALVTLCTSIGKRLLGLRVARVVPKTYSSSGKRLVVASYGRMLFRNLIKFGLMMFVLDELAALLGAFCCCRFRSSTFTDWLSGTVVVHRSELYPIPAPESGDDP